MAHKVGTALVAAVVSVDKQGKKHVKETESIGDIMQHPDGRLFIRCRRYMNFADLPGKDESNFVEIGLNIRGRNMGKSSPRDPGQEG